MSRSPEPRPCRNREDERVPYPQGRARLQGTSHAESEVPRDGEFEPRPSTMIDTVLVGLNEALEDRDEEMSGNALSGGTQATDAEIVAALLLAQQREDAKASVSGGGLVVEPAEGRAHDGR